MKGHKEHHHSHKAHEHKEHRKHKATGGVNEAEEDEKENPEEYNHSRVEKEAEERKAGGRAKRKRGGNVKHIGEAEGERAKHRADRKPRKTGGRAGGSNSNPFSSAEHGEPAKRHTTEKSGC